MKQDKNGNGWFLIGSVARLEVTGISRLNYCDCHDSSYLNSKGHSVADMHCSLHYTNLHQMVQSSL